jgi:hypothetical protein
MGHWDQEGSERHVGVWAVVLVALFALTVVASLVAALRRTGPWPRKPHLGHWRRWDDDE